MIVSPKCTPHLIPCDVYDADGEIVCVPKIAEVNTTTGVVTAFLTNSDTNAIVCQDGAPVRVRCQFKAPLTVVPRKATGD